VLQVVAGLPLFLHMVQASGLNSTSTAGVAPDDVLWFLTTELTNAVSWLICFSTFECLVLGPELVLLLFEELEEAGTWDDPVGPPSTGGYMPFLTFLPA
jgi:hypothetical protein